MNILVLGGDGFLGSHLIDKIDLSEHRVTVFDRFKYDKSVNLEHVRDKIIFKAGEFANKPALSDALKDQDIVYHFISCTSPPISWNDPLIEIDQNLGSSIPLFDLSSNLGVKKIVFASSGGTVYGLQNKTTIDEATTPHPYVPYGITKLTIEYFLNYFHKKTGLSYDIFRIANPYGPRQPMNTPQGVIAIWMDSILKGKEIAVFGNSTSIRDYIYVEDVATLLTQSLNELETPNIYNVGSNEGISILELLEYFKKIIVTPFKYIIQEKREFDNLAIVLDSTKIYSKFPNFIPTNLETGLIKTWKFLNKISTI